MFRRAIEVWREEGPRSFLVKVMGETFHRRLWLIERDPGHDPPHSHCTLEGVECRPLGAEDVDAYLALRPEADRAEILRRLEAGHQCFAVWKGDRIINAGWVGKGRCWVEYLDLEIELAPGTGYLYEVFTAEAYRGHRVSSERFAYQSRVLAGQGCRRTIAAIWPENRAVAKSAARATFDTVGEIGYWGFGPLRYRYCRCEGENPAVRLA